MLRVAHRLHPITGLVPAALFAWLSGDPSHFRPRLVEDDVRWALGLPPEEDALAHLFGLGLVTAQELTYIKTIRAARGIL